MTKGVIEGHTKGQFILFSFLGTFFCLKSELIKFCMNANIIFAKSFHNV